MSNTTAAQSWLTKTTPAPPERSWWNRWTWKETIEYDPDTDVCLTTSKTISNKGDGSIPGSILMSDEAVHWLVEDQSEILKDLEKDVEKAKEEVRRLRELYKKELEEYEGAMREADRQEEQLRYLQFNHGYGWKRMSYSRYDSEHNHPSFRSLGY